MTGPTFTFWMRREKGTDTYTGQVTDDWGWSFSLTGKLNAEKTMIVGTGVTDPPAGPFEVV